MKNLQFVDRKEELSAVREIISETLDQGQLISLIGIEGIGKTTLLKMLKYKFDNESNNQTLSLMGNVLSVDTPITFFGRFFSNFETKIHPTKHKFKEFIKKHADVISLTASITTAMTGIPTGTNIGKLLSPEKSADILPSLETHFINMAQDFVKKFPNHKLIFLIDDIDKSNHIDDFVSFLEDIKSNLPTNTMIMVSSTENVMDVNQIIQLSKFNEYNIQEFVKKNISGVSKDDINQIIEKSGGYPLALHWLWQNHRKGEDIGSLLLRLPREGFLQQLQANFLGKLEEDEVKILNTCAALDVIDSRVISKVSELEQQLVNEILDNLLLSSVLMQINYQKLANKQMVEIYMLDETFQKLVESTFGKNIEIHKKILQYFVDALIDNLYPIRNSTIAKIVNQLEAISKIFNPSITQQQVLMNLEMDVLKKFNLAAEIISYHWFTENKDEVKKYAQAQYELAQTIENPNYKRLYTKQAELNKLVADEKYDEAKKICYETAHWLESLEKNEMNEQEKVNLTRAIETMKSFGDFMMGDGKSDESFLRTLLGEEVQQKLMSAMENKIFRCVFMLQILEETLTASNYDVAIELGMGCLEQLNSVTDEDLAGFEKTNGSKMPSDQLELLKSSTRYDLGVAYFSRAYMKVQDKEYDKKEIRKILEKAVENLASFKSDPVRGQFYHNAKALLNQL